MNLVRVIPFISEHGNEPQEEVVSVLFSIVMVILLIDHEFLINDTA